MRTLDYEAVRREARSRAAVIRVAIGMDGNRDQYHDEEQWQALLCLDRARLQRWLASGRLRILGPRRFELTDID